MHMMKMDARMPQAGTQSYGDSSELALKLSLQLSGQQHPYHGGRPDLQADYINLSFEKGRHSTPSDRTTAIAPFASNVPVITQK